MKFNIVQTLFALAISGLIGYGFYHFNQGELKLFLGTGSFIFLSLTLIPTIGINFILPRTTRVIKTVSGVFFLLAFISSLIFSYINFSVPGYVIINGILILLFTLLAYSIQRAKQ